METLLYPAVFLAGAIWGSFFLTLALRMSDESFTGKPRELLCTRSRCPRCGAAVPFAGLIPLLGYMVLRAKCAECGAKIPLIYPAAELGYGLLAIALLLKFGVSFHAFYLFILLGTAVTISIIDIKTLTIPGSLCAAFFAVSVFPVAAGGEIMPHILGAGGMFAFFAVIMLIFPGSFGGGDVKFAAVLGFFSGWEQSIVVLEAALVLGSAAGSVYALVSGRGLRIRFPFAPPLAAGLAVSVFWGETIARAWLGLFP